MARIKTLLLCCITIQFQWLSSSTAGPLGQSAQGVDNASDTRGGSSSGSDSNSDSNGYGDSGTQDEEYVGTNHLGHWGGSCAAAEECQPVSLDIPTPTIELSAIGQKVRNSDGSFHLSSQLLFGRAGASARFDHYFEEISDMHRSEDVRVNLFELSLVGRVVDTELVHLDLRAGLGATSSTHYATISGLALGATATATISQHNALRADFRFFALDNEIEVGEISLGAQLSYLWLGYRGMKFDVGPLIEGPEIGIRAEFN